MVTEQVINLKPEEKARLQQLLAINLLPANKVYRYNYFYNNCTTKARDIIEQCIDGSVEYAEREGYTPSYRDMVHEMTRNNPWSRFGNDLLLGIRADQPTTLRQQEFLPNNLMHDFDGATILHHGISRPLVERRSIVVATGTQLTAPGFPLTPLQCSIILLVLAAAIFLTEWKLRRSFLAWDLLLMVLTGTVGIVLTLMLFSKHPTVSLNLQILLFNPLPWFFLWQVARRRPTRYWRITAILSVLFLVGALFQSYAEGIHVVALCLLMQCYLHHRLDTLPANPAQNQEKRQSLRSQQRRRDTKII